MRIPDNVPPTGPRIGGNKPKEQAPQDTPPPPQEPHPTQLGGALTQKFLQASSTRGSEKTTLSTHQTPEQEAEAVIDFLEDAVDQFREPIFTDPALKQLLEKYRQAIKDGTFQMDDFKKDLTGYWSSTAFSRFLQDSTFNQALEKLGIDITPEEKQAKDTLLSLTGISDPDFKQLLERFQQAVLNGTFKMDDLKKDLMSYWVCHPVSGPQDTALTQALDKLGIHISQEQRQAKEAILVILSTPFSNPYQIVIRYRKCQEDLINGTFSHEDFQNMQKDFKGYWITSDQFPSGVETDILKILDILGAPLSPQEKGAKKAIFSLIYSSLSHSDPSFLDLVRKYRSIARVGDLNIGDFQKALQDYLNSHQLSEADIALIQAAINGMK